MAPKAADKAKKEAMMAKAKAKQKASRQQLIMGDPLHCWVCLELLPGSPRALCPPQAAEDKTFGLKNKNKSAKVQK